MPKVNSKSPEDQAQADRTEWKIISLSELKATVCIKVHVAEEN